MYYRVIYESLTGDLSEKLKPLQDLQPIYTSCKKALAAYLAAVRKIDTGEETSLYKNTGGRAKLSYRVEEGALDFLRLSSYDLLNDLRFSVRLKMSYYKRWIK